MAKLGLHATAALVAFGSVLGCDRLSGAAPGGQSAGPAPSGRVAAPAPAAVPPDTARAPAAAVPPTTAVAPAAPPAPPPELRAVVRAGGTPYVLLGPGNQPATGESTRIDERYDRRDLRTPAPPGRRARVYFRDGVCDGSLGATVLLRAKDLFDDAATERATAAPVDGCTRPRDMPLMVALDPPPSALVAVTFDDPLALAAREAARAEALRLSRVPASRSTWTREHAWRLGDAVYAQVQQMPCTEEEVDCMAVAEVVERARAGAPPEAVIVRRPHVPEGGGIDVSIDACQVLDYDGDGGIELLETVIEEYRLLVRLVRATPARAGDVVWRASFTDSGSVRPAVTRPAPLAPSPGDGTAAARAPGAHTM